MAFEGINQAHKGTDFSGTPGNAVYVFVVFKGSVEAGFMLQGIIGNPVDGCQPDSSFRNIDNPADAQVVKPVIDGAQIGKQIFDFPALIEIDSPHNAVGDIIHNQFLLKDAGLGIGAVEDGEILIGGKVGGDDTGNGV